MALVVVGRCKSENGSGSYVVSMRSSVTLHVGIKVVSSCRHRMKEMNGGSVNVIVGDDMSERGAGPRTV
eukprot:6492559-Amphidinium_carterae.4